MKWLLNTTFRPTGMPHHLVVVAPFQTAYHEHVLVTGKCGCLRVRCTLQGAVYYTLQDCSNRIPAEMAVSARDSSRCPPSALQKTVQPAFVHARLRASWLRQVRALRCTLARCYCAHDQEQRREAR